MSATTIYVWASVVLFLLLSVLLSGRHWFTVTLKIICIGMLLVGVIIGLANSGIVVSNGIRLI